jgi:hypothetical protein
MIPVGAGAAISPGKKERAVTATKANPKVRISTSGMMNRFNHSIGRDLDEKMNWRVGFPYSLDGEISVSSLGSH